MPVTKTLFGWMDEGKLKLPALTTVVFDSDDSFDYGDYWQNKMALDRWDELLTTTLATASQVKVVFPYRQNEDKTDETVNKEVEESAAKFLINHAHKLTKIQFTSDGTILTEMVLSTCTHHPPRALQSFTVLTSDVADKQIITEFLNTQTNGSLQTLWLQLDENLEYWKTAVLDVLIEMHNSVVSNLKEIVIYTDQRVEWGDAQLPSELLIDACRALGLRRCSKLEKFEIWSRIPKQLSCSQFAACVRCFAPQTTTQSNTPKLSAFNLCLYNLKFSPKENDGEDQKRVKYRAMTSAEFAVLLQNEFGPSQFNGKVKRRIQRDGRSVAFVFTLNERKVTFSLK